MSDRPDRGPGDVIDWLGHKVLILSTPTQLGSSWTARAMYLTTRPNAIVPPFEVMPTFNLHFKPLWEGTISDEDEALIMKMMLIHGG